MFYARQADRRTGGQTGRRAGRQAGRQTDRQTGGQAGRRAAGRRLEPKIQVRTVSNHAEAIFGGFGFLVLIVSFETV
ncbi:MAG: hypothetical protein LBE18_09295 [Planctomycetaceae bacterium]|nr:hypothetical protein [Planctomycetaceae bacterium]